MMQYHCVVKYRAAFRWRLGTPNRLNTLVLERRLYISKLIDCGEASFPNNVFLC